MIRSVAVALTIMFAASGAAPATAESLPPPWLPKDPGTAHCVVDAESARLFDDAVAISLNARDGALQPDAFENRFTGRTLPLKGELFTVTLRADKSKRLASQFRLEGALSCRPHHRNRGCGTRRRPARRPVTRGHVRRCHERPARALANAAARRQQLRAPGRRARRTKGCRPLDAFADRARRARLTGTRQRERLADRHRRSVLRLRAPDGRGTSDRRPREHAAPARAAFASGRGSAVFGRARRRCRPVSCAAASRPTSRANAPHRSAPSCTTTPGTTSATSRPYTEAEALAVIRAYGEQLVKARGVQHGFLPVRRRLGRHRRAVAVQQGLPLGLRAAARRDREDRRGAGHVAFAVGRVRPAARGASRNRTSRGLRSGRPGTGALGAEVLRAVPRHDASNLLRRYGINQFKLDGTGSPDKVTPGSEFDSDFAAAIALIGDLRAIKPDLFINLTTGTWPSPFWLLHGRFHLARRRGPLVRRRRQRSPALDHLSRRRHLRRHRAPGTAVPAQLADAPRHHLRAQGAGPRPRCGRRFRGRGALLLRERHRAAGAVRLARPAEREELGRPRRGRASGPAPMPRCCATVTGLAATRRAATSTAGLRGRPGGRRLRCAIPATGLATSSST